MGYYDDSIETRPVGVFRRPTPEEWKDIQAGEVEKLWTPRCKADHDIGKLGEDGCLDCGWGAK